MKEKYRKKVNGPAGPSKIYNDTFQQKGGIGSKKEESATKSQHQKFREMSDKLSMK